LADAIRFICENPEIYIKMSKNALKRFEEEFIIEKEILRILEIYNKLLEDKG